MTKWKRTIIIIVTGIGVVGFLLGYIFFNDSRVIDPNADRLTFVAESSFPGVSALFTRDTLYIVNADSPGLTRVTKPAGSKQMPAWSTRGDKIAYRSAEGLNVVTLDEAEANQPELLWKGSYILYPVWSPDDSKIAFADGSYGADGLYVINTDGSGQPELLWRGTVLHPAWSPDGSKIAFSDRVSIHIFDIETGQIIQLTDGSIPGYDPIWSSDGAKIAFALRPAYEQRDEPNNSAGIAVINIDGSDFTQLTVNNDSDSGAFPKSD